MTLKVQPSPWPIPASSFFLLSSIVSLFYFGRLSFFRYYSAASLSLARETKAVLSEAEETAQRVMQLKSPHK